MNLECIASTHTNIKQTLRKKVVISLISKYKLIVNDANDDNDYDDDDDDDDGDYVKLFLFFTLVLYTIL